MAGAKETPRQKMIGMMYLVLLAMLALQVSNAVLEKFAIVNETLNSLVQDGSKKSEETLTAIVDKTGKSTVPKVVRARENAQKVRQMTKDLIAYHRQPEEGDDGEIGARIRSTRNLSMTTARK